MKLPGYLDGVIVGLLRFHQPPADKAVCFVALKMSKCKITSVAFFFNIMTRGVLWEMDGNMSEVEFSISAGNLGLISFYIYTLKSKGTEVRARFILTFPLVLRAADRIRLCALSSGMGQRRSAADLQQPLGPVSTRWDSLLHSSGTTTTTRDRMYGLTSTPDGFMGTVFTAWSLNSEIYRRSRSIFISAFN